MAEVDALSTDYRIERLLGQGGAGHVYLSHDLQLDRTVAVKVLRSFHDENDRERFFIEARALSGITHPGVCAVYKVGVLPDTSPYMVLEYVEGQTLRQRLSCNEAAGFHRLPCDEALRLTIALCHALTAIHEAGIVHRDLKPDNIMLADKGPKLIDFGLCRMAEQDLTQTGYLLGSVMYMSPEQSGGQKATAQSDLYSLGCVLFEALTGKTPFDADNNVAMLYSHVHARPFSLTEFGACDERLDAIMQRCLKKKPADRYASAQSLAAELSNLLADAAPNSLFVAGNQTDGTRMPANAGSPRKVARQRILIASAVTAGIALLTAASLTEEGQRTFASLIPGKKTSTDTAQQTAASRLRLRSAMLKKTQTAEVRRQLFDDTVIDLTVLLETSPPALQTWSHDDWSAYSHVISEAVTSADQITLQKMLCKLRTLEMQIWLEPRAADKPAYSLVHATHLKAVQNVLLKHPDNVVALWYLPRSLCKFIINCQDSQATITSLLDTLISLAQGRREETSPLVKLRNVEKQSGAGEAAVALKQAMDVAEAADKRKDGGAEFTHNLALAEASRLLKMQGKNDDAQNVIWPARGWLRHDYVDQVRAISKAFPEIRMAAPANLKGTEDPRAFLYALTRRRIFASALLNVPPWGTRSPEEAAEATAILEENLAKLAQLPRDAQRTRAEVNTYKMLLAAYRVQQEQAKMKATGAKLIALLREHAPDDQQSLADVYWMLR